MNTFESLLVGLSRQGINYILVGGLAVELCGFSRSTLDVDILVDDDAPNLEQLLEVLASFGNGSASELKVEDFTPEEGCIRVIEDFPLDIFTRMGGHSYGDLEGMTALYQLEGTQIRHLDVDGLLLLKGASSRAKDKIDVDELRRLKKQQS